MNELEIKSYSKGTSALDLYVDATNFLAHLARTRLQSRAMFEPNIAAAEWKIAGDEWLSICESLRPSNTAGRNN